MLTHPISVYINWASYDELSDNVPLTETLALRQLNELLRLRGLGVRFDYYLMDAFWYARDGGYRTWRWPSGADRWLDGCLQNGVKPGLWVATNNVGRHAQLDVFPAWRGSLDEEQNALCCFYGGFLPHFIETLHLWYERGVRMYKFDFANFTAAPEKFKRTMLPSEIRAANVSAFQGALKAFRQEHPEVVLIAYNGFEEGYSQGKTDNPLRKVIDHRWLDTFDSLYCGDPRPADVPAQYFWRSKDIYSDHMVFYYLANNIPSARIDNSGFMIGTTGTCYYRGKAAWKGMLLLSLARGGWVNTYYGNLELLDSADADWFARAQHLLMYLQQRTPVETFGGLPGQNQPYGFALLDGGSGLIAVVNPAQQTATVSLPVDDELAVLFSDAGFEPRINGQQITLGPEQMALVGVGAYADVESLGQQADVVIPRNITPIEANFAAGGDKTITTRLDSWPENGSLRVIMRQKDARGYAKRTTGGSPPNGTPLGQIFRITAEQNDQSVPVTLEYDKAIWSGLSWAAGEIACADLTHGVPLTIRCSTSEPEAVTLSGDVYHVVY